MPYTLLEGDSKPASKRYTLLDDTAPSQTKDRSWSDVPLEALKNVPSSAYELGKGLVHSVAHPIETIGNLGDIAAGGLKNITPKPVSDFIDKFDPNPTSGNRAVQAADTTGNFYKNRYGSLSGLKNTLATDPIGAVGDLSAVLGIGAELAPGKVSSALSRASSITNPISAVAPVVKAVAGPTANVGSHVLGMTTGVGAENVKTAARSGLEGKTSFYDNLTGKADMTDVLDTAKQNLQNMAAQKNAEYRANMANVKGDKTVLNFTNIDDAVDNANKMVNFKGQSKNPQASAAVQNIADEVEKWKQLDSKEFHTPEGLDALKQRIGGIVENIPFEQKSARLAAGNIYNSIKSEISKQAPTYANTMKEYTDASDTIREIERALSLGNKASVDTAMRKLQSLSRNNVNTNYGNRLDLAKTLEQQGGNEILPAIAGQAMNTWMPRGLAGQAEGIATLGAAAMHHPAALGLLPFQSPKAVGATAYGAGRLAGMLKNVPAPMTAEQAKFAALLSSRASSIPSN